MITHLEPGILECEVKWALESITTNKASGGDGIPVELFQILKDDAVKVLHSICQQIWKTQQGHRTGKVQFSFQSLRKAIPNNAQTTAQLHSPLYVTCCFSLAAFSILFLCLVFVSFINLCLGLSPGVSSLLLLDLTISFTMLRKFSTIISSKIFSYPFFYSSSSGIPIIQMLVHLIVS